jgi:hypothetical protein
MSKWTNITTMIQADAIGMHSKPWPATMKRCKDNLRIPASKYSPRGCVWRPKSERPTRHPGHEMRAAWRWRMQGAYRVFDERSDAALKRHRRLDAKWHARWIIACANRAWARANGEESDA